MSEEIKKEHKFSDIFDKEFRKYVIIFLISLIILLSLGAFTLAQPSQITNKILLSPYYLSSMTANTWYNYQFDTITPDGMSEVSSVIVTLDSWINPTRTFNILMNGQSCNTPSYIVSTTYASAGRAVITFDCSNVIKLNSNNNVSIQVTGGNIGSSTAFVEVTYINNPKGKVDVLGTEYIPNEPATIFLQLVDSQNLPELDGACYLDIFSPLNNLSQHPYYISDAPMLYNGNDDGVYYYDLITPNITGVYMLSASCSYSHDGSYIYIPDYTETHGSNRTSVTGTFTGNTINLNQYDDYLFTQCASASLGGTRTCDAYYDFNASHHLTPSQLNNISTIEVYYMLESDKNINVYQQYYNWSSGTWINLTNTITLIGSVNAPTGTSSYISNTIPSNSLNSTTKIIRIRNIAEFGSTFTLFDNFLSIRIVTSSGSVQNVKGSSEMHISDFYNRVTSQINNVPNTTWNYQTRNLTYYQNFTIPQQDLTNYTRINDSVNNAKNEIIINDNNNFNTLQLNITQINNKLDSILLNLTNIFNQILSIPLNVWTYNTRNLTYYENFTTPQVDLTNYTLIQQNQYNYTNRFDSIDGNLSEIDSQILNINSSIISNTNNNFVTLNNNMFIYYNNTLYNISQIPMNVWIYNNRNLTYYENFTIPQQDLTNYTLINEGVWNYNNRTLTYYQVNNLTSQDVWNYVNRTLTYYEVNNISTTDIWTYNNRTLTFYPSQTDLTNYTLITDNVWNYVGRYTHGVIQ